VILLVSNIMLVNLCFVNLLFLDSFICKIKCGKSLVIGCKGCGKGDEENGKWNLSWGALVWIKLLVCVWVDVEFSCRVCGLWISHENVCVWICRDVNVAGLYVFTVGLVGEVGIWLCVCELCGMSIRRGSSDVSDLY